MRRYGWGEGRGGAFKKKKKTHQIVGGSDPSTSKKSYFSSVWKSVKMTEMVSPGSASMVHVQSALL